MSASRNAPLQVAVQSAKQALQVLSPPIVCVVAAPAAGGGGNGYWLALLELNEKRQAVSYRPLDHVGSVRVLGDRPKRLLTFSYACDLQRVESES